MRLTLANSLLAASALFVAVPATAATGNNLLDLGNYTATSGVNNAASIVDGISPADGTHWQNQAWWTGSAEEVIFDLGGDFYLESATLIVDNNDDYALFTSQNGSDWRSIWEIDAMSGSQNTGLESFQTSLLEQSWTSSSYLKIVATGGDGLYGVGELTVSGVGVLAVPEPETYAMFLAGIALVGAVARRRA